MVLVHQAQEPIEQLLTLLLCHVVNVAHVPADREDTLPSSHGIRPDDRMNGSERRTDILGRSPGLIVELESISLGRGSEAGLVEGDSQGLEELLVRLAEKIVHLIAAGPQGVSAGPRKRHEPERRVIRGDRLESNVAVPLPTALLLGAEAVPSVTLVVLLILLRADGADLKITTSKLTLGVEEGVDVET